MASTGNGVFKIDGLDLRVNVVELKRSFAVTDTEHSGRVKSDEMHRDIIGTYYSYTMAIEPIPEYREDYDTFYEIVSAPEKFHRISVPYGQATLEMQAYITKGDDSLQIRKKKSGEVNLWSGLSVQFTAKAPQRRP